MVSRSKKILEEIHPLNIIREVQKWPVLYVKDSPERANLHFKNKVWNEIAKALFADWDTYCDIVKESKVSDLMKKWRNLRDTFKRQLEAEKKMREGYDIKRKTYVYFKHMLYLLPHLTPAESAQSDPVEDPKLNEYFSRHTKRKISSTDKKPLKKKKRLNKRAPINSIIIPETSKATKREEIDEDKHFLMSLIPSFKKMSDDEKLEAKLEILKIIKGIRQKSLSAESNPVADSLSYNLEEADIGEIKIEMCAVENEDDSHSNASESSDSEVTE